jgi:hypothetical protein
MKRLHPIEVHHPNRPISDRRGPNLSINHPQSTTVEEGTASHPPTFSEAKPKKNRGVGLQARGEAEFFVGEAGEK